MNYQMTLDNELIVDNFAGGGGASTGIEMGLGRPVNIAINHDREAVAMHQTNHPQTQHYCEDVWEVDPRVLCAGRPVALAWFSPDCKHFSKAKGGRPVEKKIRGLAWVAIRWAATVKPRVIMLENVEEFVTWGPITEDGRPCPERKGQTFQSFVKALQRLGYAVEWRDMRACDYGAPTIRKRLFLIARRDGQAIVWPQPTHGDPRKACFKQSGLKPWRTAAECIDWTNPAPSIFSRPRPLADNTLRRVAKGFRRYVLDAERPFIIGAGGPEYAGKPRSVDSPMLTIPTENHSNIVVPYLTEHANASNPRVFPADEPLRTQCAQVKGGHFAMVMPYMVKHFGGVVGTSIDVPAPTQTTRGTQNQIATAYVTKMRGDNVGHPVDEPLHTVSAGGTHHALTTAYMVKYYGNEKDGADLQKPVGTVTTKDRFGLIQVESLTPATLSDDQRYNAWWTMRFLEDFGVVPDLGAWDQPRPSFLMLGNWIVWDIGMRMLTPRELYRAQGFPETYIIDHTVETVLDPATMRLVQIKKPLNKTGQVHKCGNSVSPVMACALARANIAPPVLVRNKTNQPSRRSA